MVGKDVDLFQPEVCKVGQEIFQLQPQLTLQSEVYMPLSKLVQKVLLLPQHPTSSPDQEVDLLQPEFCKVGQEVILLQPRRSRSSRRSS